MREPGMIESCWERLTRWGAIHAPAMLEDLNRGASEAELSDLESRLGLEIPADFRRSLTIHDGEHDGWPKKVFANGGAYLGTGRIRDEWAQRLESSRLVSSEFDEAEVQEQIRDGIIFVEGAVRPVLFQPEWIPIMEMNGDVFWAIDLLPDPGGVPGQIIKVDWEACSWRVIASSFGEYLSTYVDDLESGRYRVVNGLPSGDSFS